MILFFYCLHVTYESVEFLLLNTFIYVRKIFHFQEVEVVACLYKVIYQVTKPLYYICVVLYINVWTKIGRKYCDVTVGNTRFFQLQASYILVTDFLMIFHIHCVHTFYFLQNLLY